MVVGMKLHIMGKSSSRFSTAAVERGRNVAAFVGDRRPVRIWDESCGLLYARGERLDPGPFWSWRKARDQELFHILYVRQGQTQAR